MKHYILVVEDAPFWQNLIQETLAGDYQVRVVATYDEAKQVLRKPSTRRNASTW